MTRRLRSGTERLRLRARPPRDWPGFKSEIAAILKSPEVSARIAQEVSRNNGPEFARVIENESNKWRQLIAQAGIKAE